MRGMNQMMEDSKLSKEKRGGWGLSYNAFVCYCSFPFVALYAVDTIYIIQSNVLPTPCTRGEAKKSHKNNKPREPIQQKAWYNKVYLMHTCCNDCAIEAWWHKQLFIGIMCRRRSDVQSTFKCWVWQLYSMRQWPTKITQQANNFSITLCTEL